MMVCMAMFVNSTLQKFTVVVRCRGYAMWIRYLDRACASWSHRLLFSHFPLSLDHAIILTLKCYMKVPISYQYRVVQRRAYSCSRRGRAKYIYTSKSGRKSSAGFQL